MRLRPGSVPSSKMESREWAHWCREQRTEAYTVANLPDGTLYDRFFVTDALGPTFGATVVGGGAVLVPVYFDGSAWKVG